VARKRATETIGEGPVRTSTPATLIELGSSRRRLAPRPAGHRGKEVGRGRPTKVYGGLSG